MPLSKIAKHQKICLDKPFMFEIFDLLASIRDYGSSTNNSKGLPNKVVSIISSGGTMIFMESGQKNLSQIHR